MRPSETICLSLSKHDALGKQLVVLVTGDLLGAGTWPGVLRFDAQTPSDVPQLVQQH